MPRITRYWAHDPSATARGILAGYEPAALKAAQDRGIIFIAELDDGTDCASTPATSHRTRTSLVHHRHTRLRGQPRHAHHGRARRRRRHPRPPADGARHGQ